MDYKNALCVGMRASRTRLTLHVETSCTTLEASSPNHSLALRGEACFQHAANIARGNVLYDAGSVVS